MNKYKFQELFSGIGKKSTEIKKKTVTIIGVGGLGSVVAEMLQREGINMRIIDKGRIELPDLQRQTLYLEEDDNKFKAKQIKKRLEIVDSKNKVKTFHEELMKDNLFLLDSSDLIIDCSNDLDIMKIVGEYVKKKTPLINCKYAGSEGAIFISNKKHLFKEVADKIKVGDIAEKGIINATVHFAAGVIVSQTLKTLVGEKVTDNFIVFDVWKDQIRRVNI
ncbi:MAG: ThiF family adenylyltransferase [Nanoarchaeota archaeon]|nr:ThiF family adenylyltransferase [Nanoarchaeota archaeon]MBU1270104.1 ThiF family adenylyltransferase [Nanoarchaeota archaeon]MBU1604549.1 ThiF family adenylyltransferase [Nanoarchaeota archaeon]MBU2459192.1 ThiF family adenylyltransferase [Nanoarchaeota archaeon]